MQIDIEVIGFDIKKNSNEEKQLQEIAKSGGGSYLPASNAAELSKALQATVDESIRKNLPPARRNEPLRFESLGGSDREKTDSGPGRQVDTYAPSFEQYDMGGEQKQRERDIFDKSIQENLPPARGNEPLGFESLGGSNREKTDSGPGRQVDTYAPGFEQYDMGGEQKQRERDIYAPDYQQGDAVEGQVETR
ncbi:MAG: hypothetical protein Q7J15_04050 [Candidatus Desulfaltia sp.]|nr:hypothetical protein [Candidatus Desulfaltia sp.]